MIRSFHLKDEVRAIVMLEMFVQKISEQSLFAIGLGITVTFVYCLFVHLSPLGRLTNNPGSFLGPQKIHTDPTPRIGGLGLIIAMFVQALFLPDEVSHLVLLILLAVLPVFLAGFAEDVTNAVSDLYVFFVGPEMSQDYLSGAQAGINLHRGNKRTLQRCLNLSQIGFVHLFSEQIFLASQLP